MGHKTKKQLRNENRALREHVSKDMEANQDNKCIITTLSITTLGLTCIIFPSEIAIITLVISCGALFLIHAMSSI